MHTISSKTFSKINYIYNYDQLSVNANLIFIYCCPHLVLSHWSAITSQNGNHCNLHFLG